jgi:hypothetical protein
MGHAPPATDALSNPPSAPRTRYRLRSRHREVYKAEAPIDENALKTYDVGILIAMPHSHTTDDWNELGEYVIGTSKLVVPTSPDDFIPS